MEILDLHISVLTPLHIGCDEQSEPTSSLVDGGVLWDEIDLFSALSSKESRDELKRIAAFVPADQFAANFAQFKNSFKEELKPWSERITPVAKGMESKVRDTLNSPRPVALKRTSYDPLTHLPIIPGTSLKGVLRGLLLGALKDRDFNNANWSFAKDPMSLVSVGDFFPSSESSARMAVVGAPRLYKGNQRIVRNLDENSAGFREVVLPAVSAFTGRLLMKRAIEGRGVVDAFGSVEELLTLSRNFVKKFMEHNVPGVGKFWQSEHLDTLWPNKELSTRFQTLFDAIRADDHSVLLRIGSAAGKEHTSLDWLSGNWRQGVDGKPPHTWSVAKFSDNRSLPMGWAVLTNAKHANSEKTKKWQNLLATIAQMISDEVVFPNADDVTSYRAKRVTLAEQRLAAVQQEKQARQEQEQIKMQRAAEAAQREAEQAQWSEFKRAANNLCERIVQYQGKVAVNNNLWAELRKIATQIEGQKHEDKEYFMKVYSEKIKPKLDVPKEKLKELSKTIGNN